MTHALSFVWNPSEGIDLGFFLVRYYSLTWVVAFLLGWFIMKKIYDREGETTEKLDKLFIYTIVATMIGARLGHVLFYQPEMLKEDFVNVFLPFSFKGGLHFTGFAGLASHGAAIAIIISVIYYCKKVIHRPILWMLDRIVIPVTSGGIFIRIGNFINSEILGDVTSPDTPTAVKFIRGEEGPKLGKGAIMKLTGQEDYNKAYEMVQHDPKFADTLASIPYRHPAQLYEAFLYIFVFAIIYYMYWKTESRKQHGLIFGVFLVLLWSVRFIVEFVKQSQGGFESELPFGLLTGQWLSIPFILVGFYLIFTAKKRTETL